MADYDHEVPNEGDQNPFEDVVEDGSSGEQMSREAEGSEPSQPTDGGQQAPDQPGGQPASENQEQQQSQQPAWDPNEYALNYRGTRQLPASKEELINLAQQGFSYSQEMARLKQERQKLQEQYGHYNQFDQLLRNNPALAQRVAQTVQEYNSNQGGGQTQQYVPPEVFSRLQYLEQEAKKRAAQDQDRLLDQEVTSVKQRYPNHDWKTFERQLLQFAYNNGITNLDHAYRALTWENAQAAAKATALKQQQQARVQATQQGIVQQGQSTPPQRATGLAYSSDDSYDDVTAKMLQALSS